MHVHMYVYVCVCVFTYMYVFLVGFYGISTLVGYLMPNHVYTYILNINNLETKSLWPSQGLN